MSAAVRIGYKQTEVGVIPEDWNCVEFQSLASSVRNAIVGGPFGSDLVSTDYVSDGVPVIRGQNMGGNRYLQGPYVYVSQQKARSLEANLARPGDVVFTQRGTMGQVSLVPENPFEQYLVSQSQMKVTVKLSQATPDFVHCWFDSERGQRSIHLNTIQTGVPHINLGILKGLHVPCPPILEQRAIATALSDVDALLSKLDALIAKKRDLKVAAMQQLLTGQIRLPGFSGAWEVKRLGDVVEIRKGQLITEKDAIFGSIPVIAGGKKPSYFHNQPNRVGKTITVSASGASAGYVAFFDTPIFASDCSTIGDSKTYSIEFIYFQLLLKQDVIYRAQTGGAQPHIHAVDLIPLAIGVCSFGEQTAIATILSDMDTELAALETRRDKTRALKQGMMQELLTGRIRLV